MFDDLYNLQQNTAQYYVLSVVIYKLYIPILRTVKLNDK